MAIKLFASNPDINLSKQKVIQAYGLSKMTVPRETEDGPTEYNSMIFVEFLEMIGRIAYLKFDT